MLGSLLEGAKATVRRAGSADSSEDEGRAAFKEPSPPPEPDGSLRDDGLHVRPPHQLAVGEQVATASEGGAAGRDRDVSSSVSRSFSLLRASGARAMLPVKMALSGDPEAVEARESLTKYKATLSAAVAEAEGTTTSRREDLELLTAALAGQESDLRCWGYVSVLASFKEHRRRETNRAQLRVGMSERREEVITAKLQEVGRLLRSMPIIGPWTNKPAGAETESLGFRGGIGGDGHFWEEAFAVSPGDLLAFDEDLALARQRLVACDRACAAAADAFAMKVVAAGGLEPRSPEDRAQALLSLLSRYHVLELGESVVSGEEETGQDQPTVKSSPQDLGGTQVEEDREEAGKQQPREEEGEAETRNPETERVPAENTGRPIERRKTVEDEADQGKRVDEQANASGTISTGVQDEQAKGDEGEPHRGGKSTSPEGGDGTSPEDGDGTSPESGDGTSPEGGDGTSPESGDGKSPQGSDGGDSRGRDHPPRAESDESRRSVDGWGPPAGSARFSRLGRKDCEVAFSELMLDERNREGRLLRRFLTMAQADKSPPPPPPPPPPPSSSNPAKKTTTMSWSSSGGATGTGGKATTLATTAASMFSSMRRRAARGSNASGGSSVKAGDDKNGAGAAKTTGREPGSATTASATVGKTGAVTGDGEEGEGPVGPQVVKAFINYFSKEYLVNMFDVPDFLVPTMTGLVALLVFRQARRLVFGYDRRRVAKSDEAWREKASAKTDEST
ncbi:hypothetical protein Esi_0227_0036 [Ectocarpus siliculosus]|uniref:Uncharacterized protein n=1 Tax=Ectocarpus siliculosus TaxID=2880 RepID=D7FS45_ECTSI|nr:hypothetical protein Esi_0227_0036 [Ectocarpus siliculosus]|eukprot:CBJ30986.1 hypothetical protein Esi_0227_0036 [Ectocarpus siliculosus]